MNFKSNFGRRLCSKERYFMAKLFPYIHRQGFLNEDLNKSILTYAVERANDFELSKVYSKGMQSISNLRSSSILKDLGSYKEVFTAHILEFIPEMIQDLQISQFSIGEIELEFAAHGDKAFFVPHIDTVVHEQTATPRMISAVYYFHSQPRKFTGGDLRLHTVPIGSDEVSPKDISPDNNSLLVFPSFAPHEVLPVAAPDVEFKDWRFAVNCWIHRA